MQQDQPKSGFTLIELLVVIAIIGVLTAVLLANMVGIRERGADTKIKNDLKQFKTALRLYYNDNQGYPPDSNTDCESIDNVDANGDFLSDSGSVYMRAVPTAEDTGCNYTVENGGEGFVLRAVLKNSGDPDIRNSALRCDRDPDIAETNSYYYDCTD